MKKNLVRMSISMFILIAFATTAYPQWVQTNWSESNIFFKLYSNQDIVFARIWDISNGGRVFFTDDNGTNWTQISSAKSDIDILSIVTLNNDIIAGTWKGFYKKSVDDTNWEAFEPSGIPADTAILSLAIIDNSLFAGTDRNIYKSSISNINSWTKISTGIPANARIISIIANDNAVFAISDSDTIFVSINGGTSWTSIKFDIPNTHISQLAAMGTKLFLVTLESGVFVSNDNGMNWTQDSSGLEKVNCFLTTNNLLWAGTDSNGVYLSQDIGQTWISVNSGLPANTRIWSLTESGNNIFAGTIEGIWRINPEDINDFTITSSASEGGTISPEGDISVYETGSQAFTITPVLGYKIGDVLVDGVSAGTVDSYTFSNVKENHTISVIFAEAPIYTITASTEAGGTISPSGTIQVSETWSKEFTITSLAGHAIDSVLVDGTPVGAVSSYKFTNITGNHTISVIFKDAPFIINASAGTGGSISPSGNVEVWAGNSKPFTITPSSNYEISDVLVDGVSVGAVSSYTFPPVSDNHTISASFSSLIVYQINCGSSAASPYIADKYYNGGTTSSVTNTINMTGVTDPAPQKVYQTERDGNFTYTFPDLTSGDSYKVRLHFSENAFSWGRGGTSTTSSRFNVAINETAVLSDYSIEEEAGARNKAVVKEFTTTANASGQIEIEFVTVTNNAKVGGIEIIKQQ
jgi:photosystem II stability/assembly factor-like uncharacterized protein